MSKNTNMQGTKIRGTVSELLAQGLTLNGNLVDQPALSVITRMGFAKAVDKVAPRGTTGKGKPSTVWEFGSRASMAFSLNPSAAAAAAAATIPASTSTETADAATSTETADAATPQATDSTFANWDAEQSQHEAEAVEA